MYGSADRATCQFARPGEAGFQKLTAERQAGGYVLKDAPFDGRVAFDIAGAGK